MELEKGTKRKWSEREKNKREKEREKEVRKGENEESLIVKVSLTFWCEIEGHTRYMRASVAIILSPPIFRRFTTSKQDRFFLLVLITPILVTSCLYIYSVDYSLFSSHSLCFRLEIKCHLFLRYVFGMTAVSAPIQVLKQYLKPAHSTTAPDLNMFRGYVDATGFSSSVFSEKFGIQ